MRATLKILFLFFVIFSILPAYGQEENTDSLKKQLSIVKEDSTKIDILYILSKNCIMHGENDSAMVYINQGQFLANQTNNFKGQAKFHLCLGFIYEYQSEYKKSLRSYTEALKIYQKLNDPDGEASMFNNIGNTYLYQGDYPQALKNYLNSLQKSTAINDAYGMANASGNIGSVYKYLGKKEKCLEYYFKSLKLGEQIDDQYNIANSLGNIGAFYIEENRLPEGIEYCNRSLSIKEKLGDKLGCGNSLVSIGSVFKEFAIKTTNKDSATYFFQLALDNYTRAESYFNETNTPEGIASVKNGVADVYLLIGKYNLAIENAKAALQIGFKIKTINIQKIAYEILYMCYEKTEKKSEALAYYKSYIVARDSLVNEEKTIAITRSEMNFEFEKKQAVEKAEQEKKDALASEELKQQKFQRNSFIIGFALMLILAIFIFRSFRQKQKANKIIAQQKHEVEIQKELVEEKQKEIVDSITYAKRLQQAILPPTKFIDTHLIENFVLYKPKDIVAGDFYWMEVKNDLILIAAADCTGHGVPGAMVSVVCSNALNRTVKEFGITDPGKILDKVRELVIETFEKSESEVKDGMDISLCSINKKTLELKWAGANNPLWYFQNNEMKEVTANKQPIGKTDNPLAFTTNSIQLNKGDQIYLFTDGYADQFGGDKGKKFKYKQFQELLIKNKNFSMLEQKKNIDSTIENWKGDLEQVDDILVIGIRV